MPDVRRTLLWPLSMEQRCENVFALWARFGPCPFLARFRRSKLGCIVL